MPMQLQFIVNNDGCGDHVFTQEKRSGNVCIYRRNKLNGDLVGFEVIVIKVVKAGTPLPGGNFVEKDYEKYPGAKSFGLTGWYYKTLQEAEKRFTNLLKSVPVEDDEPLTIPDGEFTQVDFATANCLPPRGKTYDDLQKLVDTGIVRVSRRIKKGAGQPTCLYIKA
jgi:hypothetical protein